MLGQTSTRTEEALARAIRFLADRQLPDGEFGTFVSSDDLMQADCLPDSTPFTTALVLYSLRFVGDEVVRDMRARGAKFLQSQHEGPGVWRFWTTKSKQRSWIPPDLDDTCCSAHAIRDCGGPALPIESVVLGNRNREGLFHTWLVPRLPLRGDAAYWRVVLPKLPWTFTRHPFWRFTEAAPDDVDGVVNANVLLCLGEREETRPIVSYLLQTLAEGREETCDKWHLNRFNVYYMISRAYFAGARSLADARQPIVERIEAAARDDGSVGNALETALAACALLNFDESSATLDRAIDWLLNAQAADGSWPRLPLYYGGPKRVYGWGCEELTTAFTVEALARYAARTPASETPQLAAARG
jgi:hypothetical protein